MRSDDELRLVVALACLTTDRTPEEQRALMAVARRTDRAHNRQSSDNPWLRQDPTSRESRIRAASPCEYSRDHQRRDTPWRAKCPCAGYGLPADGQGGRRPRGEGIRPYAIVPADGWSHLEELAALSWEPDDDSRRCQALLASIRAAWPDEGLDRIERWLEDVRAAAAEWGGVEEIVVAGERL